MKLTEADFRYLWIPRYPSVSNDFEKEKSYHVKRDEAWDKRYIQTNALKSRNLLTVDLDIEDADTHIKNLLEDDVIPEPSYWTINPASTKAHVGWFIDGFVHTPRALYAFQQAQNTLRDLSGGDEQYKAYMGRNPLCAYQWTAWGTDHLYTLSEIQKLAPERAEGSVQRSTPKRHLEQRVEDAPEGTRNTTLFDELRVFAYRAFNRNAEFSGFVEEVQYEARSINYSWSQPLDEREMNEIAERVIDFIAVRFSKETFSKIQQNRSAKRKVVQQKGEKYASVLLFLEHGFSIQEIASLEGISYDAAKKLVQRVRKWADPSGLS